MDTAEWLDFKCGISRVTAREKVRVAKCLVVLSKVEKAFAEGRLSYSKVRALVRVAKLETEDELLEFAIRTPASFLEKRLAELRNGSSEGSSSDSRALGSQAVELRARRGQDGDQRRAFEGRRHGCTRGAGEVQVVRLPTAVWRTTASGTILLARPTRWCSWPEDHCPGDSAESAKAVKIWTGNPAIPRNRRNHPAAGTW